MVRAATLSLNSVGMQIVSPSLSQSESPVAVDLRIHARNDGRPLAQAPMVHAGRPAVRRDRAGVANTILGLVRERGRGRAFALLTARRRFAPQTDRRVRRAKPDFEKVLLKGLSRFSNVAVAFEHSVGRLEQDERGVTMTISTPEGERNARAAYVVACDGGTSGVRERLGVKLKGSTFAQRWLVVDAIVRGHNVKGITFTCDPRRPTVELPAVGDRVRWEFMQLPGECEDELKREENVRALVKRKAGIDAFEIERKAVYTFHARVADR